LIHSERGKRLDVALPTGSHPVGGQAQRPLLRRVVAEPPYYSEVGKAGHMGKGGSMISSADDGEEVVVE